MLDLIAITLQAVGTLLVAALLWQLTHVIKARFLQYWASAWIALAVAMFSLRLAVPTMDRFGLGLYCGGEYVFGFLLWAGFRDFTRGTGLARREWFLLTPFLAFAAAVPFLFSTLDGLFPIHAPLQSVWFLAALWATRTAGAAGRRPVGLFIVRATLTALGLAFLHYGPVLYYAVYHVPGTEFEYLGLSPVFDAVMELGLAFGMVTLAAERAQSELAAINARLTAATKQLAEAARTDVLTGLLNRRAFDELCDGFAATPFGGCLAAIDLNDLKPLNDGFGHAAGDAALQVVARALRNCCRVTDPVFRVGGDEFVVVLPGGSEAELTARLEKLERVLSSQRLPGVPEPADLRVAFGVAAISTGVPPAVAMAAADRAMYIHKGRAKRKTVAVEG